jgi:monofunctional biosynthetic peptidoglycan transglycosylase
MRFLKRWFLRLFLLFLAAVLAYQLWIFGHVFYWNAYNPSSTAFMRDRLGLLRQKNPAATLRVRWVPYEQISQSLKRAVIAAEDGKFPEHEGFDFDAMQKAYQKNLQKGRVVAGGSTISQQLAKNLFLSGEKTPWRKLQEAVITFMLEKIMSKRRILEIYLNVIEWGNGVFGAEAATRYYYGVSASSLSAEQAAHLAAMIPNPRFYDLNRNTPWLLKKTGIILRRMPLANVP